MSREVLSSSPTPAVTEPGVTQAPSYPKWFEGVTDQAGRVVPIFCGICRKQLTVLGCTVGPWTGYVIQPHRCR